MIRNTNATYDHSNGSRTQIVIQAVGPHSVTIMLYQQADPEDPGYENMVEIGMRRVQPRKVLANTDPYRALTQPERVIGATWYSATRRDKGITYAEIVNEIIQSADQIADWRVTDLADTRSDVGCPCCG